MNVEEMDRRVTAFYNDWWKVYRGYTSTHDMGKLNREISKIKGKYRDLEPFITDFMFPFVTEVIVPMHAEYLRETEK